MSRFRKNLLILKSYYLFGDNIDAELTDIQKETDFVRVIQIIYLGEMPV